MPGLPLQVRARSGEATRGGVAANPGENPPRDLLLLGLLKRRVGGAPAIRRVLGGRFDQSSRHDRGRRASAASRIPSTLLPGANPRTPAAGCGCEGSMRREGKDVVIECVPERRAA